MRLARRYLASLLTGAAVVALSLTAFPAFAVNVTCTGSSSMAGVGSSEGHHIADEMANALGPDFMVSNFGVAATTAIKALPNAYASTPEMAEALASNPDVVLFWFGGNDSWADVWPEHGDEFKADYLSLVQQFQALPSQPKTFLIRLWVFQDGPAQLDVLDGEILPMIDEIAAETNSTVIDYRSFIEGHTDWFDDGMHANDTGTVFIGQFFAEQITAALNATPDAGAPDPGGMAGASGASGAPPVEMPPAGAGGLPGVAGSVSVAGASGAASPTSMGGTVSSGGTMSVAGSQNASGAAGTTATAMPGAAPVGNSSPAMTEAKGGGCGFARTPRDGFAVVMLAALAALLRRRQATRR